MEIQRWSVFGALAPDLYFIVNVVMLILHISVIIRTISVSSYHSIHTVCHIVDPPKCLLDEQVNNAMHCYSDLQHIFEEIEDYST